MLNAKQRNLLEELELTGVIDSFVNARLKKLYSFSGDDSVYDVLTRNDLAMWEDCKSQLLVDLTEIASLDGIVMSSDLCKFRVWWGDVKTIHHKGNEMEEPWDENRQMYDVVAEMPNGQTITLISVDSIEKAESRISYYENNDVLCFTSATYRKKAYNSVGNYFYKSKQREYKRQWFSIDDENYTEDIKLSQYIEYWDVDVVQQMRDSDIYIQLENHIKLYPNLRKATRKNLLKCLPYFVFGFNGKEIAQKTEMSYHSVTRFILPKLKEISKEFLHNLV